MDGILLVDKPIHWTSHDLVDALRRLLGIRRIGHAGTLDPLATGLMILLIGKATSAAERFSGLDKEYRGSMRFGTETDSWDLDGRILSDAPSEGLTLERLRHLSGEMLGERLVEPPQFSAVKVRGVRGYERARRGERLQLEKRPMRIDRFDIEAFESPEAYFLISCSKGTYIRSLCREMGRSAGQNAALSSLVRTRIGRMHLSDALTWPQLRSLPRAGISLRLKDAS